MPRLPLRNAPSRRAASGRSASVGLLGVLAASLAAACATGNGAPATADPGDDDAGAGAAGVEPSVTLNVRAVSPEDGRMLDALKLEPLQTVKLVASVKPTGSRLVRFSLSGDALDAVLLETDVTASPLNGTAETLLTAPSAPRTFAVRVTTVGAEPNLFEVAVPSTGLAKLAVSLGYEGRRSITEYTATAWENTTCADLTGAPPDDGSVSVTSSTWPVPLEVAAGVPLAVILRAGKYIWGCTTVDAATEGLVKEVQVTLTDVPIKLDTSQIRFTLSLEDASPFTNALGPAREALLAALVGEDSDDVEALLDAMRNNADDSSSFSSTRRAETWDSVLREALPNAAEALRGPLRGWIDSGILDVSLDEAVVGELKGAGVEGAPPTFTLASVFGLSPSLSTFAPAGPALWTAQADDTVLIGVELGFDPGGFLLGAATTPALDDAEEATDLAGALSAALSCKTVAKTLLAHGESSKSSYGSCDEACTEELCRAGVRDLYTNATTPAAELGTLDLALSGAGGVGVWANLTALSGNWIGKLIMPPATATLPTEDAPFAITVSLTGLASARDPTASEAPTR